MKKVMLFCVCISLYSLCKSQSFIGINTSNYAGVSGVFYNPSNAADSRFRWSVNLLQLDVSVANNATRYKLSALGDALDADKLLEKLYDNRSAYAQANVDVLGPSLQFNINRKTSFALTSRTRALATLAEIDGKLVQAIHNEEAGITDFQTTNNNTSISINGWTEIGLTWGNVIYNAGEHFLKGGVTVKYLGGISHTGIKASHVTSGIQYNGSSFAAVNASGTIDLAFDGLSITDPQAADVTNFSGSGLGFDLGLTYEYRPQSDSYRSADSSYDRAQNKYKLKVGLSLLDAGSIKYNKDPNRSSTYQIDVKNSEAFDLGALHTDLDDLSAALAANPAFFTPVPNSANGSYKITLPTRLRADVDYQLYKKIYVNLATQLAVNKAGDIYKTRYYNNTVLTPRVEGRALGLYLPLQVNNVAGFDAGLAIRLGALVVGSSNLLSWLGGSQMVNAYAGFRLASSMFSKGK